MAHTGKRKIENISVQILDNYHQVTNKEGDVVCEIRVIIALEDFGPIEEDTENLKYSVETLDQIENEDLDNDLMERSREENRNENVKLQKNEVNQNVELPIHDLESNIEIDEELMQNIKENLISASLEKDIVNEFKKQEMISITEIQNRTIELTKLRERLIE